jgi:Fe-S-cluster-containing dehydrogenase component
MPIWKYSSKEVSEDEIYMALNAISYLCFKCGQATCSEDCPIRKLAAELKALKESKDE